MNNLVRVALSAVIGGIGGGLALGAAQEAGWISLNDDSKAKQVVIITAANVAGVLAVYKILGGS